MVLLAANPERVQTENGELYTECVEGPVNAINGVYRQRPGSAWANPAPRPRLSSSNPNPVSTPVN